MYSLNPYQGCEHGCVYCYARNTHQYWGYSAGLDFELKIIVKKNASQLLEACFEKKSWTPAPIFVSGNTDCYQPIERKLRITRSLLEVFLKRSEEHTSELQSLMRISYAVFCLKKKRNNK